MLIGIISPVLYKKDLIVIESSTDFDEKYFENKFKTYETHSLYLMVGSI